MKRGVMRQAGIAGQRWHTYYTRTAEFRNRKRAEASRFFPMNNAHADDDEFSQSDSEEEERWEIHFPPRLVLKGEADLDRARFPAWKI